MTKLTGIMPKLMQELTPATLRRIDTDPMLSVKRYDMDGYQLCIANASKVLHSPTEIHQMFAKGIVYKIVNGEYVVVALPFVKFYNSFEGVAVDDMKEIAQMEDLKRIVYRKYDGTLISRFVLDGEVYFATRGRIINLEDNDFWKLLTKVIKEKGYKDLLNPDILVDGTAIFELIGPSNVIVEFHAEDDLVMIGYTFINRENLHIYSEEVGVTYSMENYAYSMLDKHLHIPNTAEVYNTDLEPDALVKSWEDVREGVIVTFIKDDEVVYRMKIKQEAYLNLVRAKNKVSKENLIEMIIENRFKTWDEVENHLKVYLGGSAFFEELVNFYKEEWPNAIAKVEVVRKQAGIIEWVASEASKESVRKNQFFLAKKLLDGDESAAGLVMGMISGKYDVGKLVEILFNRAKK